VAKASEPEVVKRTIRAVYYNGKKEAIRTNHGSWPRTMTLHAVDHLQLDSYGATVCEVFDIETGTLHAVLTRSVKKVEIIYKREPKNYDEPKRKEE
jgi:hypothetical protein